MSLIMAPKSLWKVVKGFVFFSLMVGFAIVMQNRMERLMANRIALSVVTEQNKSVFLPEITVCPAGGLNGSLFSSTGDITRMSPEESGEKGIVIVATQGVEK